MSILPSRIGRRCQRYPGILSLPSLILWLAASTAQAHPHGWVDYTVRVLFNDQSQVTALQQRWKMDPMYSLTLTEDLNKDGGSQQQQLDALGGDIVRNIAREHYLTHVYRGGKELDFGKVTEYTTMLSGQRVEFMFVLPLATPQAPEGNDLIWKVYDPTYFIEFLYDNEIDEPLTLSHAPPGCMASIVHFKPDPRLVAKAAAIDVTGQAPDGMGKMFADTGKLQCPAR
ncbi:DUF1007 family protein [Marinobacter halodurans]|uniref:DUF1007 family protein n=1 Tax=Marinobacter halodurans TaxID=2528979 RepID=A0ABY1ZLT9_9GAMM|nr:DUF1007 family protein [Marinobacter halodurans]TBW53320.1 DUF1007 family protein [Marinobacter halodurans]